ncbi:MAG TPA: hypothetical protein VK852_06515 [Desulfobacterales bacterium]|nr:hypothetical protein [Desulfobacterales bacterium]
MVHAGFALHKIDEETARESLDLLRAVAPRLDAGDPPVA